MMSAMKKMSLQSFFCDALAQVDNGNFTVTFWDGAVCTFGQGNDFKLHFKNREALKRVLVDAPLGFGEGYMHGDIEVEGDLRQVVSIGLMSRKLQEKTKRSLLNTLTLNLLQRNSKRAAKKNIAHHYDLGNEFYRLWLDLKMIYSCAYFTSEKDSLEQAQMQKINLCCRKLQLQPDERLLDIGSDWCSLLIYEARIRAMFDDRFIRMWRFYLAGCSASFRVGTIHLFQLLFSAGVRNDLPLTREWMLKDYPA